MNIRESVVNITLTYTLVSEHTTLSKKINE